MKLVSVAQMKQIEKEADAAGVSYAEMMEMAGRGLALFVQSKIEKATSPTVLGLVGSGNNGGDTLIALAILAGQGWRTGVYLVRPRAKADPLVARLESAGGKVMDAREDPASEQMDAWLSEADVVLDGVLGTGFSLPLRQDVADVLRHVSAWPQRPLVLAVDCPSGVDCDSGAVADECIRVDVTLCMEAVKQGLLRFPAYAFVGDLQTIPLNLPVGLEANASICDQVVTAEMVKAVLPARLMTAHKGTFGTVMVVAGSVNYTGAALLASQAAYRSGAGLVTAAVPALLHSVLAGILPEATWILLPHEMGVIADSAAEVVLNNLDRVDTLLLGPGLGLEATTAGFVRRLLSPQMTRTKKQIGFSGVSRVAGVSSSNLLPQMVIDADGLKLMAQITDWANLLPSGSVLTPHPGEMAVLTGMTIVDIQQDRMETARRWAKQWGHVVVLKGALTVVAAPDGRSMTIPVATAALAKAGSGDVLAGIIAALLAQGMDAFEAAWAAAWLHGQAGLKSEARLKGSVSVLASDVLSALPQIFAEVKS